MKLTKSQLKQIIKEEISNLDEGLWGDPSHSDWGWKVASDLNEIETTLEAKANEIEKATSEWRNLPNPEIQYREEPAGEEEYEEETL